MIQAVHPSGVAYRARRSGPGGGGGGASRVPGRYPMSLVGDGLEIDGFARGLSQLFGPFPDSTGDVEQRGIVEPTADLQRRFVDHESSSRLHPQSPHPSPPRFSSPFLLVYPPGLRSRPTDHSECRTESGADSAGITERILVFPENLLRGRGYLRLGSVPQALPARPRVGGPMLALTGWRREVPRPGACPFSGTRLDCSCRAGAPGWLLPGPRS